MSPDPPGRKFRKLQQFAMTRYGKEIEHRQIGSENYLGLDAPGHLSLSAYNRIFLGELLPDEVKEVLYLDCDLIVYESLGDVLFESLKYFEGPNACLVRAAPAPKGRGEHLQKLGHSGQSYFNSGVLFANLDRWRTTNFANKAAEIARQHAGMLPLADQDVLNLLLENAWDAVDLKFNQRLRNESVEAAIVHFVGAVKPWHIGNRHPNRSDYDFFRKKTPFWPYLRLPAWKRVKGQLKKKLSRRLRIVTRYLGEAASVARRLWN